QELTTDANEAIILDDESITDADKAIILDDEFENEDEFVDYYDKEIA
ncbi:11310_t:CDS:1, partial [Racocetra fulgida]